MRRAYSIKLTLFNFIMKKSVYNNLISLLLRFHDIQSSSFTIIFLICIHNIISQTSKNQPSFKKLKLS